VCALPNCTMILIKLSGGELARGRGGDEDLHDLGRLGIVVVVLTTTINDDGGDDNDEHATSDDTSDQSDHRGAAGSSGRRLRSGVGTNIEGGGDTDCGLFG